MVWCTSAPAQAINSLRSSAGRWSSAYDPQAAEAPERLAVGGERGHRGQVSWHAHEAEPPGWLVVIQLVVLAEEVLAVVVAVGVRITVWV
jgi:hypothetical protein